MNHTDRIKLDPAKTVIERFSTSEMSGVRVVAEITGVDRSSVHKWMWPKSKRGTGGLIPSRHLSRLKIEADRLGIEMPAELLIGEECAA